MNVLALDMTLCNTGYVVCSYRNARWSLTSAGLIEAPKEADKRAYVMALDLSRTASFLRQLQRLHNEFHPRHLVVEQLAGTQSARSATTFGLVTGALAAFMESNQLAVTLIRAPEDKKRLTGSKTASKEQMIRAALRLHPTLFDRAGIVPNKKGKWPDKVEHIADAYALFLTAADGPDLRRLTQLAAEMASNEEGIN